MEPNLVGMDIDEHGQAVAVVELPLPELHPAAVTLAQQLGELHGDDADRVLLAAIFCELRMVTVLISETTEGLSQVGSMMQGGLLGRLLGGRGD